VAISGLQLASVMPHQRHKMKKVADIACIAFDVEGSRLRSLEHFPLYKTE
jgi:hypothetical protein